MSIMDGWHKRIKMNCLVLFTKYFTSRSWRKRLLAIL